MKKYLLDTNICIYFTKGLYDLKEKITEIKVENCFISEITIAELKFGIENSDSANREQNRKVINSFIAGINVLPIFPCLDFYAREKTQLRKLGTPTDEFDLLIGSTAVVNDLILVTNNEKHFKRISEIKIENWTNT